MAQTDEIVQYFIVNSELSMSPGKVAAQVAHVATLIAHDYWSDSFKSESTSYNRFTFENVINWQDWFRSDQPKIILRGKQKQLEKLIDQGWYYINDLGRTEIEAGSLTVVGCRPGYKSDLRTIVKRFQLL